MSDREKKLLIMLVGTLFVVVNVLAFKKFYQQRLDAALKRTNASEMALNRAESVLQQQDSWEKAGSWLERSEGEPIAYQTAQANLQSFVDREAKKRGLITRDQQILPWQPGEHYNRVRVRYRVTGMEQQIQQWLMALRQNRQLQVITKFEIKPVNNDITKVDCEVEVEKFILPIDDESNPL